MATKETAKVTKETAKVTKETEKAVEEQVVVTGTIDTNGDVLVNTDDVIKVKANKANNYGLEKWNHVAKLPKGDKGLVYVWDTREIVGVVNVKDIEEDDLVKSVRDSGSSLKLTKNTSDDVKSLLGVK